MPSSWYTYTHVVRAPLYIKYILFRKFNYGGKILQPQEYLLTGTSCEDKIDKIDRKWLWSEALVQDSCPLSLDNSSYEIT